MSKKTIETKIKSYSALTAGLLATTGAVQGQISYVDVDPDSLISNLSASNPFNHPYNLDINDDSFVDFVLEIKGNALNWLKYKDDHTEIRPLNNNEVLCDNGTSLPKLLSLNDSIDVDNTEWKDNSSTLIMNYFKVTYNYGVGVFNTSSGNWQGGIFDKYLGLKMEISSESYYGWVRLDVGENKWVGSHTGTNTRPTFTVKEYAMQQFPGVPIKAGAAANVVSSAASNLVLVDLANNGNGSDLQVSFNKAINEAKVKEYHLIAVKSANAAAYNDSLALLSVVAGNSTAVAKTGSSLVATFASDAKDTDGDPIVNDVAYKVFVVSAPDGYTSTILSMSAASNELTLTSALITSINDEEDAMDVSIYQNNNNLHIDFNDNMLVDSELNIYDITGRSVETRHASSLQNANNTISLETLNRGMYIVRITNNNKTYSKKIILR